MSIELYNGLSVGVISGTTVNLHWDTNFTQGLAPITSCQVQRKRFGRGDDDWVNVGVDSLLIWQVGIASNTPGVGDWSYRLKLTVTQGGVDGAGTAVYSNEVNVTTEVSGGGAVHLALGSQAPSGAGGGLPGHTQVILGFDITGSAVDVRFFEVQRSLNSGAYHSVAEIDEFEVSNQGTWSEVLPAGIGTVTYKVIAHLPSATPPYQADVLLESSTQSITL